MSSEPVQTDERCAGSSEAVELVELGRLDRRLSSLRLPSPTQLARLRASVEREGVRNPVIASMAVATGTLVLVDGFKRVRLLEERGAESVLVRRVSLDAAASAAAVLRCNAAHRGLCELEEAWVVRSLCREHKVAQVEVGRLLGRHKSWVCRRLKLAEVLEEAVQADIRLGLLSSTVARELARLPRGNQQVTGKSVRDHGLTSRQAAELVTLLLGAAEPEARAALLSDPQRYLSVRSAPPAAAKDPRLTASGNEVRRGLLSAAGASQRLLRCCQTYAPAGLVSGDAAVLTPQVEQHLQSVRLMQARLTQLLADSRPGPRGEERVHG